MVLKTEDVSTLPEISTPQDHQLLIQNIDLFSQTVINFLIRNSDSIEIVDGKLKAKDGKSNA